MTMPRKPIQIDPDKLRAEIRKFEYRRLFLMLDDAIELLPPAKLGNIAKKYIDLEHLCSDPEPEKSLNLLADVKLFEKASLAGEYYESFNTNSQNYRQQSAGTCAWIARHGRLLDRCVADAKAGHLAEVRAAMDILFARLDRLDEGNDDVIFFADEGGSWQVGTDWAKVLPAWFKVLSATAEPEEYARQVTALLSHRCHYDRDKMLAVARRIATKLQRKALKDVKIT